MKTPDWNNTWWEWTLWFSRTYNVSILDDDSGRGRYDILSYREACDSISVCEIAAKVPDFKTFNEALRQSHRPSDKEMMDDPWSSVGW